MTSLLELKSILKNRGLHLNKKLGQHLLIDSNIRRKIIEIADLSANDSVIEIGAGMGFMTEELINYCTNVHAVEIDKGFVRYLHEIFKGKKNLTIIHDDILRFDLEKKIIEEKRKGYSVKILGNLPYNINTPIITKIAEIKTPIASCFFVVQKEVAERYVAVPGSKNYGAISVYLQYRFQLKKAFFIPKNCFFPKPDVESAAISLFPYPVPPVKVLDEELFFSLIRTAFSQRRKMILNSIKRIKLFEEKQDTISKALEIAHISPTERPEKISLEFFAALTNALSVIGGEKH